MKIIDLLDDRSILLDGRVADKKAAPDGGTDGCERKVERQGNVSSGCVCKRTGRKHWYW